MASDPERYERGADGMNALTGFRRRPAAAPGEGFSLVEVLIATVILSVGLLAILAVFGQAVSVTQFAREDQVAKQKAREALESIYSARNDTSISFDDLRNVSSGGIFKDGFQPLYLPGANGIVGTGQDTTTLDHMVLPGPDKKVGTTDDITVPLVNMQRQILITKVTNSDGSTNSDLRHLTVTVRVASPGRGLRDYAVTGFISRFQ